MKRGTKLISRIVAGGILREYRQAKKRIVFLDYDGTLVPFFDTPDMAVPSPEVLDLINRLRRKNKVILISGRDRITLGKWFGRSKIVLSAEHGAWLRNKSGRWKRTRSISRAWKKKIISIMAKRVKELSGSFVEEKDYSVAWHYRVSPPRRAAVVRKALLKDLVDFDSGDGSNLSIIKGNKVIEVRSMAVDKGSIVRDILGSGNYDFILCMGDDATDEDMFRVLERKGISVKVGTGSTKAKYYLRSQRDVLSFLSKLA